MQTRPHALASAPARQPVIPILLKPFGVPAIAAHDALASQSHHAPFSMRLWAGACVHWQLERRPHGRRKPPRESRRARKASPHLVASSARATKVRGTRLNCFLASPRHVPRPVSFDNAAGARPTVQRQICAIAFCCDHIIQRLFLRHTKELWPARAEEAVVRTTSD
jgi:hypothetical protein